MSTTTSDEVDPGLLKQHLPESPDIDGDGDVDESDIAAINAIIAELSGEESSSVEAEQSPIPEEPTPTLAEPESFDSA